MTNGNQWKNGVPPGAAFNAAKGAIALFGNQVMVATLVALRCSRSRASYLCSAHWRRRPRMISAIIAKGQERNDEKSHNYKGTTGWTDSLTVEVRVTKLDCHMSRHQLTLAASYIALATSNCIKLKVTRPDRLDGLNSLWYRRGTHCHAHDHDWSWWSQAHDPDHNVMHMCIDGNMWPPFAYEDSHTRLNPSSEDHIGMRISGWCEVVIQL